MSFTKTSIATVVWLSVMDIIETATNYPDAHFKQPFFSLSSLFSPCFWLAELLWCVHYWLQDPHSAVRWWTFCQCPMVIVLESLTSAATNNITDSYLIASPLTAVVRWIGAGWFPFSCRSSRIQIHNLSCYSFFQTLSRSDVCIPVIPCALWWVAIWCIVYYIWCLSVVAFVEFAWPKCMEGPLVNAEI